MTERASSRLVSPHKAGTRWADFRDLGLVGYLPAAALVAWWVPERLWDECGFAAARVRAQIRSSLFASKAASIAALLGADHAGGDTRAIVLALSANLHRARLQILRCYRRPAWQPQLELVGGEHVTHALGERRGVILWLAPFIFDSLLTKMAFHRAGFQVAHLSRSGHGFSETRVGAGILNPFWTSIEDRYLAERLKISSDGSTAALRMLVERVRSNGIVSVTLGSQSQQTTGAPFLTGSIRMSDAVPRMAARTGAVLLPVFTVRELDGRFVTTVEGSLPAGDPAGVSVQEVVEQAASRLETWVRRYPSQFTAWEDVTGPTAPSA